MFGQRNQEPPSASRNSQVLRLIYYVCSRFTSICYCTSGKEIGIRGSKLLFYCKAFAYLFAILCQNRRHPFQTIWKKGLGDFISVYPPCCRFSLRLDLLFRLNNILSGLISFFLDRFAVVRRPSVISKRESYWLLFELTNARSADHTAHIAIHFFVSSFFELLSGFKRCFKCDAANESHKNYGVIRLVV